MTVRPPLRVLVAEDSPTARDLLVAMLRTDPGIDVVATARNGLDAVELTARLQPDLVTMDIRMPVMDGFEATRRIMTEAPTPIVIISAAYVDRDVEISLQALRLGALTVLPKPPGPDDPAFALACHDLVQTVRAMAGVKVVRRWAERPPPTAARANSLRSGVAPRIVAMAASTGGPAALARILGEMPAAFPLPILIVQHIAAGFVEGLASWLHAISGPAVRVARDGDRLRPATVYIAPDGAHLTLADRTTVAISATPPLNGFRPSASVLFQSVAQAFGRSAVAVILTGMGDDGISGLRAVRAAGGRIIAQDADTSVVFGMPGAALAEHLPNTTLPLETIALRLQELVDHGP